MKITKLHLKDFKIFDDLELDFTDKDGQPLNQIVLTGLNGTGKTTILEALKGILTRAFEFNDESIGDKLYVELKYQDKKIKWPTHKDKLGSLLFEEKIYTFYRPAKIRNEITRKENFTPRHQDDPFYYQYVGVMEISYEKEIQYVSYSSLC